MRDDSQKNDLVAERLRSERRTRATSPGFTERVMQRLDREEKQADEKSSMLPRFAIGFALACAALVLIAALANRSPNHVPQTQVVSLEAAGQPEPLPIIIPEITAEQVQSLAMKLDEPLDKELENVISDTRQAIQFVASSFLPEK